MRFWSCIFAVGAVVAIDLKKNKPRRNEENEEIAQGFPCFFPTSSCTSSLRGEILFLEIYSLANLVVGQVAVRPQVQLLETGEGFHGKEIKARSGEKWLGLYITKRSSDLLESTINVGRAIDVIVDEEPGQMTGKSVSVNRSTTPVFLVRGAHRLKPRKVTSIFWVTGEIPYSLAGHPIVKMRLGTLDYELKVIGERSSAVEGVLPSKPRLLLTQGRTTQIIRQLKYDDTDFQRELIWAGDLDGDGKLDLYANLSSHYNRSQRKLFLSSQAKPGQLVAEVAEFATTGC
jgi:hypothetical protein